jgi:hypothetical protein
MQTLRELQSCFIHYLTEGSTEMESMICADSQAEQQLRLDIYKNAYRIRLRQVLETDHEMLWTYLGDALFEQLVNGYIDNHPSRHTSLRNFCDQMPDYLANTSPFNQHPILAEIAMFERLLMDVFDAGEAALTDVSRLRTLDPDNWPGMRLRFHPGVQLLKADWNSIESWKALKAEAEPPAASNTTSQHWLLWRDTDRLSQFRPLDEDEYALLSLAVSGKDFSALCETLLDWHPVNAVSVLGLRYITGWLDQGLITKIESGAENNAPQLV